MDKSNLNKLEAVEMIENWQEQTNNSDALVHVIDFGLHPQSQEKKFMLRIEVYIAGVSENYLDGKLQYFYGSIVECVNQAVDKINEIKEEMRKRL